MKPLFPEIFLKYPQQQAPFLYRQYQKWSANKPLQGLRILHHVPLVQNTLLKIACALAAGADVVVTQPSFVRPCKLSQEILAKNNIQFVSNLSQLTNEKFDIFLDCGAELFQHLSAPAIGAIELTGTGDQLYRQSKINFPVISIDRSLTKQLETIFGTAVSAFTALKKLMGDALEKKSWMIFGFGKIGRGLAYCCKQNKNPFVVVDRTESAKIKCEELGIKYIDANDLKSIEQQLQKTDIVITATGQPSILSIYPKKWFAEKTLATMGIIDEFGELFSPNEILNEKRPINFILEDPTPIEYIDPELFVHNEMIIHLLNSSLKPGIHDMPKKFDQLMITEWCQHHQDASNEIEKWFIHFSQQ
jgi:adenosylhomocysteinase